MESIMKKLCVMFVLAASLAACGTSSGQDSVDSTAGQAIETEDGTGAALTSFEEEAGVSVLSEGSSRAKDRVFFEYDQSALSRSAIATLNAQAALLKANPIEVPKALVEREIDQLAQNAREDLETRSGRKMKDFPIQREWFAEKARRRVGLGLLLAEIVKAHELSAKPERVKAFVEEVAQSYEHPEEVIRWHYAQPQRLGEIEGVVIEDNVVDWALSKAKVVDKPIAFDDLMGGQHQHV